jgi:hypothetical protein
MQTRSTSSNDSQFSTPALRSTTPANFEKSIFPMDGLSHALSQENLRLHQIVHEHKVSESHETRDDDDDFNLIPLLSTHTHTA